MLPGSSNRALDHLVLCVRDLDAARAVYERLGFTLTPRAVHPWGTANFLAQLQGNFLEVLTVADPAKIPPPVPGQFTFGGFNAAFLKKREGFAMLVFQSKDARADQRQFAEAGLDTYAPFDFERKARLPDGSEARVAFSLAFATHKNMPEAVFFTCQQHAPQYFWKPEYQRHANGARRVSEVVMRAPAPAAFADFFGKLQGPENLLDAEGRIDVKAGKENIAVLVPSLVAKRFPGMVFGGPLDSPVFAGFRVEVEDIGKTAELLKQNHVTFARQGGGADEVLQIAPQHAFGVAIEFAAAVK